MLDQGRVVEFGTPWDLMQKEDGAFRDLCRQSGEEAQLYEVSLQSLDNVLIDLDGKGGA